MLGLAQAVIVDGGAAVRETLETAPRFHHRPEVGLVVNMERGSSARLELGFEDAHVIVLEPLRGANLMVVCGPGELVGERLLAKGGVIAIHCGPSLLYVLHLLDPFDCGQYTMSMDEGGRETGEEARRPVTPHLGRMRGRVAVVTGAAGGIGAALADGFASEGAAVVAVDLDEQKLCEVTAKLCAGGLAVHAVPCDLTDFAAVERLLARALQLVGSVDVLLANAGGSGGANVPFLELTPALWDGMLERNLTSAFNSGLVFARHMAASGGGAIVMTSSQLSETVRPGMAHYATAKGGIRQLVKAMAVDLAPLGIRVNAVAPGPTLTPGNQAMFERPDVRESNLRTIPLGRIAEPSEMVGAALYLASNEASFTTGTTIMVDGGYTIV